jgi:hypothetical protein
MLSLFCSLGTLVCKEENVHKTKQLARNGTFLLNHPQSRKTYRKKNCVEHKMDVSFFPTTFAENIFRNDNYQQVTLDIVMILWIRNRIYCPLIHTTHNYK